MRTRIRAGISTAASFALFLLACVVSALGADSVDCWTSSTAIPLRPNRIEVGVFKPLRYGWKHGLEFETAPLIDILCPNIVIKKAWLRGPSVHTATQHSLSYPTPLLRTLARAGTGGMFPDDSRIPHIVSSNHSILLTRSIDRFTAVTTRAGILFAIRSGPVDMPTIDLPVLFPRMSPYYHGAAIRLGLDFSNRIAGNWAVLSDLDLFLLLDARSPFSYEHKSLILWHRGEGMRILGGYKLVYGTYPFGAQLDLLPLLDVEWGIH